MARISKGTEKLASQGLYFNTGDGPVLLPMDIGHSDYIALIDPDAAFWSLIAKDKVGEALSDGAFMREYREKRQSFMKEMNILRFHLKTSCVYFNPTDRCNLNCQYCYIPETMRKDGEHMSTEKLVDALGILKGYFDGFLPEGRKAQIIFHGAEPLMNKDAVFEGISQYKDYFRFGVQTNGTLLDDEAFAFLTSNDIGIGLSLDGHLNEVADKVRVTWDGQGVSDKVMDALERLKGYPNYNVICTVTQENMASLTDVVNFYHKMEVPVGMLNPVRCTRQGARDVRPNDADMATHYFKALDRTYELFQDTGRKLVIANFANVLCSVVAPSARKLMCDISPCGGGRSFFAVAASGDMFPCSEFVGVPEFNGGNLFTDNIDDVLKTAQFKKVSERMVENIPGCNTCAVRHFCGSPCPAEAHEMNGGMDQPGAFCELYEEQVRYALRLIADDKVDAYMWDNWDVDTDTAINITAL